MVGKWSSSLKAVVANLSKSHCFNLSTFSSLGGNGKFGGRGGSSIFVPLLCEGDTKGLNTGASGFKALIGASLHEPGNGNSG